MQRGREAERRPSHHEAGPTAESMKADDLARGSLKNQRDNRLGTEGDVKTVTVARPIRGDEPVGGRPALQLAVALMFCSRDRVCTYKHLRCDHG